MQCLVQRGRGVECEPDRPHAVYHPAALYLSLLHISYILVTDSEEDEAECFILKDTASEEALESLYEMVEDEEELNAVSKVFEGLLEDVEIER